MGDPAGVTRLKDLQINGFKSFASPTKFVFDRGITAIVGPNGSGKSNVAEALRWALGEQQYSALRGRRTEDIIFAGSERRSQMGLAEVSLTIDNEDGGLPIAYSEVTITRRAHRSGENHYLINGSRVRLRDVQQLTAPLGQSHTIIGQGLVDAVLSARPEDRRGLFEHAAGITGLRLQASTAARGLNEAEENAQRLRDILGELEPRVKSLARAARQAREYQTLRTELQSLQRGYYGALWRDNLERQKLARQLLREADEALRLAGERHSKAAAELGAARQRERELTQQVDAIGRDITQRERELAEARHRAALLDAERRAAESRQTDIAQTLETLETQQREATEQAERLAGEVSELRRKREELDAERATRRAALDSAREQRRRLEQRLAEIDHEWLDLSRERARLEGVLASTDERLGQIDVERKRISVQVDQGAKELQRLRSELEELTAQLRCSRGELSGEESRRQELASAVVEHEQSLHAARVELEEIELRLERHRTRLDTLERARDEGEGLYAGVRAVVRAARGGTLKLPGLIGSVGEIIDVPQHLETAIEVALGGHLQDLVVERWDDAERGIKYLKSSNAGRATFQPLDTVRTPSRLPDVPSGDGIIGAARELVSAPDNLKPLIAQLLGRTLVVEDLSTARRIMRETRSWTVVTLEGEISRPSGSVTGGARSRAAGVLARERERRALPGKIAKVDRDLARRRDELAQLENALERGRADLALLARSIQQKKSQVEDLERNHDRLQREVDDADAAHRRASALGGDVEERAASLQREREIALGRIEEITTEQHIIATERQRLVQDLSAGSVEADERLSVLQVEIVALDERIRASERERAALTERAEETAREIARRRRSLDELSRERAQIQEQSIAAAADIEETGRLLDDARAQLEPAVARLGRVRDGIGNLERDADERVVALRETERERDSAALNVARARDEESFLIERIKDDLEIDDPSPLVSDALNDAPAAENEIRKLRDRLRRMSAVGEDVLDEYESESARYEHLSAELADVDQAAASLREVLADLHRQMTARFTDTFERVAREFEQTFKRLFGGGAAQLTLDRGDGDDPGGVDIVARPPGKRLQGLNQLSGGERALTAVALLVAIQRVNPSPFCVLDEVDAALDESNVLRFCQEIRDLASDTQFIIITHNRGTIEAADTLYGVTMGADSVSRVVSLRLDQAIRAVEDEAALESII